MSQPTHAQLLRRLLVLSWRYWRQCLAVLGYQIVLLALGVTGLGLSGAGHRRHPPRVGAGDARATRAARHQPTCLDHDWAAVFTGRPGAGRSCGARGAQLSLLRCGGEPLQNEGRAGASHQRLAQLPRLEFSLLRPERFRNALVGFTGSGKSSIVPLVAKLYLANAGEILIDGREMRRWPACRSSLRAHVPAIGQQYGPGRSLAGQVEKAARFEPLGVAYGPRLWP